MEITEHVKVPRSPSARTGLLTPPFKPYSDRAGLVKRRARRPQSITKGAAFKRPPGLLDPRARPQTQTQLYMYAKNHAGRAGLVKRRAQRPRSQSGVPKVAFRAFDRTGSVRRRAPNRESRPHYPRFPDSRSKIQALPVAGTRAVRATIPTIYMQSTST